MNSTPWVLGIGASHNGAACLLHGNRIVVAVQEERLLGVKRAWIRPSKPSCAISYCLETAKIGAQDLDIVSCCLLKRFTHPDNNIYANPLLRVKDLGTPTLMITHHLGHAISAFGTSGFANSAVLVIDGAGSELADLNDAERSVISPAIAGAAETISMYDAAGTKISPLLKYAGTWLKPQESRELGVSAGMQSFNSVGAMYSSAALQIFGNYMDAGKVMGLAPYGTPNIPVEEFVVVENGHLRFTCDVVTRFPYAERYPNHLAEYRNLAASVQQALEYAVMHLVRQIREMCSSPNLALAGGVALNSVVNERIVRESGFKNVYIIPAAEDSGTAIGAALFGSWHLSGRNARIHLKRDSLGRAYGDACVQTAISEAPYIVSNRPADPIEATVDLLCAGKSVGWFAGGSELGPRALGHRSILCDARLPDAKDTLNLRVKYREDFRPFAPVILSSEVHDWFEFQGVSPESPFMLRVVPVREDKRALIPAVVHVDGTGRLQTVTQQVNGPYYQVLEAFFKRTGIPLLLNTSLNTRGEPMVETPEDALWCLLMSGLDCCVIEGAVIRRDASYADPLDLVPGMNSRGVQVTVEHGVAVGARWITRWGEMEVEIPTDIPTAYSKRIDILPDIDGRSNGWEIIERMQRRVSYEVTPNLVLSLLAQWRRMGALTFGKPHAHSAEA